MHTHKAAGSAGNAIRDLIGRAFESAKLRGSDSANDWWLVCVCTCVMFLHVCTISQMSNEDTGKGQKMMYMILASFFSSQHTRYCKSSP